MNLETAWQCSECVSCVVSHCLPATPLPVKTNLENPDKIRTRGKDNFWHIRLLQVLFLSNNYLFFEIRVPNL